MARSGYDKQKHAVSCAKYHAENRESIAARNKKWRAENKKSISERLLRYRRERRRWVREIKTQRGCRACGENHPAVLDFHHTNKDKESSVANMFFRAKAKILEEISKCEVLCSNCHRKLHYQSQE